MNFRALAFAAALAVTVPAFAETPEGATITNTATVTYTDANGNTITPSTGSVSVQTGFIGAVDVVSPPSVTPASPSTGNELAFTVTNNGNGIDQVSVSVTAAAGVTISGYKLGATTYATLSELDTALAATNVASGGSTTVTVVYTVAPAQGGASIPLALTATSVRMPSANDTSTTVVEPLIAASVNVSPDGATASRLPSNGTQYTATFTIENTGNTADTFTLAGANAGAMLAIISVNGTAGTSGSVALAAGAAVTVDVVYTVSNSAAAGTTETLTLTATSTNDPGANDGGSIVVTAIRPALSMTKEAFRDDQTTTVSGTVVPLEAIWYRITVTNTGAASAGSVTITDPLPANVTYISASADAAGWTISESAGTVTATLSGNLAPGASRYFWIRVRVD